MTIPWIKLESAGNRYVALDGRHMEEDWSGLAIAMSASLETDGLLVARRSETVQVRMRVYNPDGSEAEMSGNGIRLFAKFILDRVIAVPDTDGSLKIETGGGIRTLWPTMEAGKMVAARVAMGEPEFRSQHIPVVFAGQGRVFDHPLELGDRALRVTCLAIGNPHCVAFPTEPVDRFPLAQLGPLVESHSIFPNRVNFEIVNILDRKRVRVRIFERGVGETASSGTGSTAAMIASRLHGLVDEEVEVQLPGGTLRVFWSGAGEAYLEGPATELSVGTWPE